MPRDKLVMIKFKSKEGKSIYLICNKVDIIDRDELEELRKNYRCDEYTGSPYRCFYLHLRKPKVKENEQEKTED